MDIKEILINTPWWVWVLFISLIYRGITLLSLNEVSPQRMLIMPCIFMIWNIYGIFLNVQMPWLALLIFGVAVASGMLIGKILMLWQPVAVINASTGMIQRAGSVLPLIIILINFSVQYVLHVYIAYHPTVLAELDFTIIYSVATGMLDGFFLGVFVANLTNAYSRKTRNR